jgi:hypothetical protein
MPGPMVWRQMFPFPLMSMGRSPRPMERGPAALTASILDTTPMALRKVSTMKRLGAKPRIIPPAHRVEKAARGE